MYDFVVIVNFPLEEDPNVAFVAWTTTPWTLPSNLSLCVHPELTYIKLRGKAKIFKKQFTENKTREI